MSRRSGISMSSLHFPFPRLGALILDVSMIAGPLAALHVFLMGHRPLTLSFA